MALNGARPEGVPWLAFTRRKGFKIAGRLLGAALVALCLYYLGRRLVEGLQDVPLRSLHAEPWPIVASVALTVLCVGLGGWGWQLVLAALGFPLALERCLAIQTTSNLAKYVPGYAWQLLGKGYLTRREGVPTGVTAYAVLLEMAALLLTGVAVALTAMPSAASLPGIGTLAPGLRAVLACAAWACVALWPLALARLGRWRSCPRWIASLVRPGMLWGALGVLVLSWLLFGVAFGCLVRAFQPLTPADWRLSLYSLTASFLVSLVTLFVPAGLGVRESVMAATLGARLPGGLPVVVALLSRLALTVSELAAFALSRLWLWLTLHNRSITRKG
jgi:hypothetical protein